MKVLLWLWVTKNIDVETSIKMHMSVKRHEAGYQNFEFCFKILNNTTVSLISLFKTEATVKLNASLKFCIFITFTFCK